MGRILGFLGAHCAGGRAVTRGSGGRSARRGLAPGTSASATTSPAATLAGLQSVAPSIETPSAPRHLVHGSPYRQHPPGSRSNFYILACNGGQAKAAATSGEERLEGKKRREIQLLEGPRVRPHRLRGLLGPRQPLTGRVLPQRGQLVEVERARRRRRGRRRREVANTRRRAIRAGQLLPALGRAGRPSDALLGLARGQVELRDPGPRLARPYSPPPGRSRAARLGRRGGLERIRAARACAIGSRVGPPRRRRAAAPSGRGDRLRPRGPGTLRRGGAPQHGHKHRVARSESRRRGASGIG